MATDRDCGVVVATMGGNELLDAVSTFIKRFVSLTEVQAAAIALWVVHTYGLEAATATPYLNVSSAEKQSGKTRLLEVLRLLVANPWLTGRASAAALVRKIDAQCPTLLLDESDAAFAGDREYAETLRGVLNSGHSRDGVTSLCVGNGANISFKDFRVFCPKAIAGIGKIPDTVADRSIPIRMKRRAPNEQIERFRPQLVMAESNKLCAQLRDWSHHNLEVLRIARPGLPDMLSDRQQDGAEPLLAIADVAGGHWPNTGRAALVALLTGEAAQDDSMGVRLLTDIRTVFAQQKTMRIGSGDLLAALYELEPQWTEVSHGKPLTAGGLSRLLKPFGVSHRKLRLEDRTFWGYERNAFEDAFARYPSRNLEQMEQSSNNAGKTQLVVLEKGAGGPDFGLGPAPATAPIVPDVPDISPMMEQEGWCHKHGDCFFWERSGDWICGKCEPRPEPLRPLNAHDIGFG